MEKSCFNVEMVSKELQSLEKRQRQEALKNLIEFLTSEGIKSEEVIYVYDQVYIQLLKCYSDKYENCRELCCEVVSEFLKKLPKNDYYLQQIVSAISNRIGKQEQIEESEELRLMLIVQLHYMIEKFKCNVGSADLLLKSYNEIIDILKKVLSDSYSKIQREACGCINVLADATPSFHYRAEVLIIPLIAMLHHKHSANRMDAIQTLGTVAMHITSNSESIIQIITEISPLLMDSMPLVRRECGRVGCRLLLHLKDRYSFFDRILPLVLCCLSDESPEVREDIQKLWKLCGQQYYEENENEINKFEVVDGNVPANYPQGVIRPTLGCRFLVKRSLRMVKLILKEVTDWKDDVRLHALKLLWQVVLHAEQDITTMFVEIYPVLSKACADREKDVSKEASKVAELIGILLDYANWRTYAINGLRDNPKIGYLKCFYAMHSNAQNCKKADLLEIAEVLSHRDFANSLKTEFQEFVLQLTSLIVNKFEVKGESIINAMENLHIDPSDKLVEYIHRTLIQVLSLMYDDSNKTSLYKQGMDILVKMSNFTALTVEELHAKHLESIIQSIPCLDAENTSDSEPILLLHGIICICGFQENYLQSLKKCIETVWNYKLPEAKIKIFTAISIATLNWDKLMRLSSDKSLILLKEFTNDIILRHLIWKPGADAESMRAMATATLCSMSQGAPNEMPTILYDLTVHFSGLIEDNRVSIRVFALRCMMHFPPIKSEYFKHVAYAVLQRLDDPSADVREWAVRVLPLIKMEKIDEKHGDIWKEFLEQVFSTLFLHCESPEIKLTEILKESLISMGKLYPDEFRNAYEKANDSAHNNEIREIKQKVFDS